MLFEEINVGDEVAQDSHWHGSSIHVVERVTKKQVVVGGNRFRREDGYVVGSTGHRRLRITPVTPEKRARAEKAVLCRKINNRVYEVEKLGDKGLRELESSELSALLEALEVALERLSGAA